jgi:hypothetical protein
VLDFLDRSRFGLPSSGDDREWLDVRIVRFQDIVTTLNNVQGFDYYTSLTINGGHGRRVPRRPRRAPVRELDRLGTVTAP